MGNVPPSASKGHKRNSKKWGDSPEAFRNDTLNTVKTSTNSQPGDHRPRHESQVQHSPLSSPTTVDRAIIASVIGKQVTYTTSPSSFVDDYELVSHDWPKVKTEQSDDPAAQISLHDTNNVETHNNDSFFSLNLSENIVEDYEIEYPADISKKHGVGEVESIEHLNFNNVHALFLASITLNRSEGHESMSLSEVLDSQRWAASGPEYIAMCASFILSTLEIYGQKIPVQGNVINNKSRIMFDILDELHEYLTDFKKSGWHMSPQKLNVNESSCTNCKVTQLVQKHVILRNKRDKRNFCLVCSIFISEDTHDEHCESNAHRRVREWLLRDIYPHSCSKCSQRFPSEYELEIHQSMHNTDLIETFVFHPICCYLCREHFKNFKDLVSHESLSLEHGCRKEIAMENAMRNIIASELCDINNFCASFTQVSSGPHSVPAGPRKSSSPQYVPERPEELQEKDCNDSMYFCSPCSVYVPKANVTTHENGQKHINSRTVWATTFSKNLVRVNGLDELQMGNKREHEEKNEAKIEISATREESAVSELIRDFDRVAVSEIIPDQSRKVLTAKRKVALVQKECENSSNKSTPEKGEGGTNFNSLKGIIIGESSNVSLQEEIKETCAGMEISDLELECGVCGVVFPIYNEDLDLSLDIHVQDDPQHQLAVAIPVERDAQNIAKTSTTLPNMPGLAKNGSKPVESEPPSSDGRSTVLKEVLKLEDKHVSGSGKSRYCKLCRVAFKNDTSLAHHLLSTPHLSPKWARCTTLGDMHKKIEVLSQLPKHRYAITHLTAAVFRINELMKCRVQKEANQSNVALSSSCESIQGRGFNTPDPSLGNPKISTLVPQKKNSGFFYCTVCRLKMNEGDKNSHLSGKTHKEALAAQDNLSVHPMQPFYNQVPQLPKIEEASAWVFDCTVCRRSMSKANEKSHIQGKEHKKQLLLNTLALKHSNSKNNLDQQLQKEKTNESQEASVFYCIVCKKKMNVACMKSHLSGKPHKKNEEKLLANSIGPLNNQARTES